MIQCYNCALAVDVQDYAATNDHAYHEVRNHHHHPIIIIIIITINIIIIIIAITTNERETQISKSIFSPGTVLVYVLKISSHLPSCFCKSRYSRPSEDGCVCKSRCSRPSKDGCVCKSRCSRPSKDGRVC